MGLVMIMIAAVGAAASEGAGSGCPKPVETDRPLLLDLPEAVYSGTPRDLFTPNLEPPLPDYPPPVRVPKETVNLSAGALVTSDVVPELGVLDQVVDGENSGRHEHVVELPAGAHYVQIDLGRSCAVHAVALWHYHSEARIYFDIVIEGAANPDFFGETVTFYNNDHDNSLGRGVGTDYEYIESSRGRVIKTGGEDVRYVRFYSRGSTADEKNHYVEAMVFGVPAP